MKSDILMRRNAPLEMSGEEFRQVGHSLIDEIAAFLERLPHLPVTNAEQPKVIRQLLDNQLPLYQSSVKPLLTETAKLLFEHSLFNGHPRFWGYITSSAAPVGMLAELLATSVNPNTGAFILSPIATEIERQTIQWIAQLIGYPTECGGIFVSGGNMANFVGFLAAKKSKATWDVRTKGMSGNAPMTVYCSKGTHTWIQKAADVFGIGTDNVRWIDINENQQLIVTRLDDQISRDKKAGYLPIAVIGTAGSVGTGSIDPLNEIAEVCRHHNLWFHIDGAYGAPAAVLPELSESFKGLELADSIALDPHKWLYSPLEAGCTLVKNVNDLRDAFTFRPDYYKFDGTEEDPVVNFHEYGLQNSRGFRALKVWLALKQVGKDGYIQMIREDISLSRKLFASIRQHDELEPVTQSLSIATFRYIPKQHILNDDELNQLNEKLVNEIQQSGEAFVSNAIVDGKYCIRACIVNFRTSAQDIEALIEIVVRFGRELFSKKKNL
jgi:glutamate/tyrosine decarboxylase-like PLP-dependent enzyme